jgi:hypothetical protein
MLDVLLTITFSESMLSCRHRMGIGNMGNIYTFYYVYWLTRTKNESYANT